MSFDPNKTGKTMEQYRIERDKCIADYDYQVALKQYNDSPIDMTTLTIKKKPKRINVV